MAEMDDDELLAALGVAVEPIKTASRTPREERIIAGFEDILRFYQSHGRLPQHGEDRDIFERLYAVRLEQIRQLPEAAALLAELDTPGLLSLAAETTRQLDGLDEDALLAELGIQADAEDASDITVLRHVRSTVDKQAAEEIAQRTPCADFASFQPLFEQVNRELAAGIRQTRRFQIKSLEEIQPDSFLIISGQIAYVAGWNDHANTASLARRSETRLRVIYDNGTESNILQRSLQRALYRDEQARLITNANPGPLFSQEWADGDSESGTIYVLRSLSGHPYIAAHRELIHKIGVTGGKVEKRIANAQHDATYLLAGVEVVATYKLSRIDRSKMEGLFHRIFAAAQIDLTLEDRFGHPVKPREWFLIPLSVIDEAVRCILNGNIVGMVYDPAQARLIHIQ